MREIQGREQGLQMFEQAHQLHLAGEFDKALAIYDDLLTQNPDNAGMLATVGTLLMRMGKTGLALSFLYRAAEKSPQSDILSNLGLCYKYAGHHDKALKCLERAIKDNPSKETLNTYAGFHINVGEPQIAQKYAEKALKKDNQFPTAHWNLAMSLLETGQWERGWDEHEWGFKNGTRLKREILGKPQWDGTNGKTLHIYGEQGLGDEIMFASIIPDVLAAGNKVIFECHQRLETLFKRVWPDMPIYGTRTEKELDWPTELGNEFDASVSIGSLGKWFRRSRAAFPGTPYLKADALPKGNKFRVGISWTGGKKEGRVVVRSIPLAWWEPIISAPNVELVSLQYTDADADIDAVNRMGYDIQKRQEAKAHDYYETAQLVASCDLVISCCTSVIHLAGALDVPTWVMVPSKPAWRYGVSGGMPWYRSVRLYRQPKGDADAWRPVIERVGFDLSELLNAKVRRVA